MPCTDHADRPYCTVRPLPYLPGQYGEDLSGGYYESGGSGLKLGAISGYTPAFLATSALCFPDGYEKTGLSDDIKFKVGV